MTDRIYEVCRTGDKLRLILEGGDVARYHTEGPGIPIQRNSEHTWRVLVLLLHLWPDASQEMVKAVIYHDVPEKFTGDLHSKVKSFPKIGEAMSELEHEFYRYVEVPDFNRLSSYDKARLRCLDLLEVILYVKQFNTPRSLEIAKDAISYLTGSCQEFLMLTESDMKKIRKVLFPYMLY